MIRVGTWQAIVRGRECAQVRAGSQLNLNHQYQYWHNCSLFTGI